MNQLNSEQFDEIEELIEHLICGNCTEDNNEKDCSSCEIFNQIKINLLNGVTVNV